MAILLASTCVFGANSQNFDSPDNISKHTLFNTPIVASSTEVDSTNTSLITYEQNASSSTLHLSSSLVGLDHEDLPVLAPSPSFASLPNDEEEEERIPLIRSSIQLRGVSQVLFDPGLVQFAQIQHIPFIETEDNT